MGRAALTYVCVATHTTRFRDVYLEKSPPNIARFPFLQVRCPASSNTHAAACMFTRIVEQTRCGTFSVPAGTLCVCITRCMYAMHRCRSSAFWRVNAVCVRLCSKMLGVWCSSGSSSTQWHCGCTRCVCCPVAAQAVWSDGRAVCPATDRRPPT